MDDQRKTTLTQKDHQKETVQTIGAITCLPIMWKILTAQIKEEIYNSFIS